MPGYPTDHAGLEMLPLEDCLRLLASVPVGRVGFQSDGEVVVLPVNHVVDGQDVIFRTAGGSKLSAAEAQSLVVFEADAYDERDRTGWSVVVNGRADIVYDDAEIRALDRLDLKPWADAVERAFWVRIRPSSVTGRRIPARVTSASGDAPATTDHAYVTSGGHGIAALQVFNVLRGGAGQVKSTPFGDVGTMYSGRGMEVVWVRKLDEPVDEDWFRSDEVDVILVVQGQLKFEFESFSQADRVLGPGEALVLPAGLRCRAYRWPRDAREATIFVAAYPAGLTRPGVTVADRLVT